MENELLLNLLLLSFTDKPVNLLPGFLLPIKELVS